MVETKFESSGQGDPGDEVDYNRIPKIEQPYAWFVPNSPSQVTDSQVFVGVRLPVDSPKYTIPPRELVYYEDDPTRREVVVDGNRVLVNINKALMVLRVSGRETAANKLEKKLTVNLETANYNFDARLGSLYDAETGEEIKLSPTGPPAPVK